jgi:SAM-dependent methyltransferase
MAVTTGSALRWGPLWGARPRDWAGIEEQQTPTYDAAIRRVGLAAGQQVLELGCGSGVFLRAAADRGARVHGVDASQELVAIARERVPEADLHVGDMQFLPYPDDEFDVVAGFNSFFFAADMVAALREARRVAKPGASVVVQVWGRPERCDLEAMKQAIAPFLPSRDSDAPAAPALWQPGVLEHIVTEAGLTPADTFDLSWAYTFPDDDALARALLSPGLVAEAIADAGEEVLRAAILEAMEPYRTPTGYALQNEWHFVIADV